MIYLKALSDMVGWLTDMSIPDRQLVKLHQALSEHIVDLEDGVKDDVESGSAVDLRKLIISLQEDRERGLSTLPHIIVPSSSAAAASSSQVQKVNHKSKFLAKVSELYKSGDPAAVLGAGLKKFTSGKTAGDFESTFKRKVSGDFC